MGRTHAEVKTLIAQEINELESRLTMKILAHTESVRADTQSGGLEPNDITHGELFFYTTPRQKVELRLMRMRGEDIVIDVTPLMQAQIVDFD